MINNLEKELKGLNLSERKPHIIGEAKSAIESPEDFSPSEIYTLMTYLGHYKTDDKEVINLMADLKEIQMNRSRYS